MTIDDKLSLSCRTTSSNFFSFITSSKDMLNRVQYKRQTFLGPHSANYLVICPSTTAVYSVSLQSDYMTHTSVKSMTNAIIIFYASSIICIGICYLILYVWSWFTCDFELKPLLILTFFSGGHFPILLFLLLLCFKNSILIYNYSSWDLWEVAQVLSMGNAVGVYFTWFLPSFLHKDQRVQLL